MKSNDGYDAPMFDTNGYGPCEATENFHRPQRRDQDPPTAILEHCHHLRLHHQDRSRSGYTVEEQLFTRDEVYCRRSVLLAALLPN